MDIQKFTENINNLTLLDHENLDSLTENLKHLILKDSTRVMRFVEEVISDISNNLYSDVFLVNLLKCLGDASLDAWVDDLLVAALSRKDIDVRDAAAKMLDLHGRYDLIRQHQNKVPWMRNYIEQIMLNDNGQDN